MNTCFLVTLADRNTGEDQCVFVADRNPERDWQDWADTKVFVPPLRISNPVVISACQMNPKRVPAAVAV